MKLADIIEGAQVISVSGNLDVEVGEVCFDSRRVKGPCVFVALKGADDDGNTYIGDAMEKGAVAVVSESPNPFQYALTWIHVKDARLAMGRIAAALQGNPSGELSVIGVTGTNGKTTTTFLIHHILSTVLHRAGLIGTIQYVTGDEVVDAPHTTPESTDLHSLLRRMRDTDCRAVAMEVSSHGLSQKRVEGVSFDVGVFTNLSQDHLDYHGSLESYYEAKKLLFTQMDSDRSKQGVAVLNVDDVWGQRLNKLAFQRIKKLTYGRAVEADFRIGDLRSDFDGTKFQLAFKERKFLVQIPLIGAFNVYNTVAALAAGYAVGLNLREMIATMTSTPQVPGRLEAVQVRKIHYRVFVDYAHTPDALENVLQTLRALEPARIITVFGCGGNRDVTKRPPMARAAELGSDLCILTSDNPRREDPEKILRDAEAGFLKGQYEVVSDRRAAIRRAIRLAGDRDIVLIAGKGHETYQEVDGIRHPFDDRKVAAGFIHEKAEEGTA